MLNETIPGGATQDAQGVWRNANGEPLKPDQIAAAQKLRERMAAAHDAQEAQRQQQALLINPAFAGAVQAMNLLRLPGFARAPEPAPDAPPADDAPPPAPSGKGR